MKAEKSAQKGILTFLYDTLSEGLSAMVEFSSIHTSHASAQNKNQNDKKDDAKGESVSDKIDVTRNIEDNRPKPRQPHCDSKQ